MRFETKPLPAVPDIIAPDGSDVRVLLKTPRGGMAHFELAGGRVSDAIFHRTVDEIWFVLSGRGEMWRSREWAGRSGCARSRRLHHHSGGDAFSVPSGARRAPRRRRRDHAALAGTQRSTAGVRQMGSERVLTIQILDRQCHSCRRIMLNSTSIPYNADR